jgi:DNA-binding LacI/PurR family transcriptional regulator
VHTAAAKLGLRISADHSLAASAPNAKAGVEAASAFASRRAIEGDAPTAIVCSSLAVARAARRELARHGLGVPRDVSLTCLRSWHESSEAGDITCAGATPAALGAAAAKAMLESSSVAKPVALAAELRVGNSAAAILPHALSAAAPTPHAA